MEAHNPDYVGHSASVRLELRVRGETFDLASIGPHEVTPRTPLELDACEADIVMFVDGSGYLWPVRLPHGAFPFDRTIETAPRGEMQRL